MAAPQPESKWSNCSDADLIAALRQGDQSALSALYDRFSGLMFAIALRMLPERSQAEDLLHDVFMEAWGSVQNYDPSRGTVRAWLVTRTRSRALDRIRKNQRSRVRFGEYFETPEPSEDGSALAMSPDRERVRNALQSLGEAQREVLELGYFGGCSSSEIAQQLQIPIGTVKSRVARGLKQLREALSDAEEGADS